MLRRLTLLVLLLAAGCDDMFGRRPVVVPPPPGWDKLGLKPGFTVREFDDVKALQRFCRENGAPVEPAKRAGDAYAMACTVGNLGLVAMPSRRAWPSEAERQDMLKHEGPHTWGLIHDDGRESWAYRDGTPAGPLSDAAVKMMLSMAGRSPMPAPTQAATPKRMIGAR